MNDRSYSFLTGVLGTDGARAFKKAIEKEASISAAVLPRTILSWIGLAARYEYEGGIPGVENTYLQFRKTEGPGYSGAVSIGEDVYSFQNASVFHVAACVAVALGIDETRPDAAREITLQRLGKSIDTLVKARIAVAELEKKKDPQPEDEDPEKAEKGELPGQSHAPTKHAEPQAPQSPEFQTQQPRPKLKKPVLKVAKSSADRACVMCGRQQFQGDTFTGCLCFRDMAAGVRISKSDALTLTLEFRGADWDPDAIAALRGALAGK